MTRDEIEFLISQHFDGTLNADESAKLRAILDSDTSAAELFAEHERLDAALKASKRAVDIDSEWLAAEIAGHIDEAQSTPMRHWTIFAPMAIAATLLVGLSLGVIFLRDGAPTADTGSALDRTAEVSLPDPARDQPAAVANVSVGVPANMTPAMMTALFLADQRQGGRVEIRPAGERRGNPFDE